MAQLIDVFDLGSLGLSSGEGRRLDARVALEPFQLGGELYETDGRELGVVLDANRTTSGWSLRLRLATDLLGPCVRCLGDAAMPVTVDAREIDQPGGGDELRSPYLSEGELDLRAWARDALLLSMPGQVVCSADCRGLCAACGTDLNEAGPDHAHESAPDLRWAKLAELTFE